MEWIPVLVVAVLVLIVIVRNIYVVQQSRAYVIERLGAFSAVWTVGMHFKAPDAVRVDTSELDFEQSFQALRSLVERAAAKEG